TGVAIEGCAGTESIALISGDPEFLQGPFLDLPHPFLRDGQGRADLAERVPRLAVEAEPQLEDDLLPGFQDAEQAAKDFHGLARSLVPLSGGAEEVRQWSPVLVATSGIERDPGPEGRQLTPGGRGPIPVGVMRGHGKAGGNG